MKKLVTISAALLSLCALAGCDSAPKDADLRQAVRGQMEAIGGKRGADFWKEELDKIKVVGCVKSDKGGFECDYSGPFGTTHGRFVKVDSGWTLVGGAG